MFGWTFAWNLLCNYLRRFFYPYLLRRSQRIYPRLQRGVYRLTSTVVVKEMGTQYIEHEAEALRFISKNTTIPVPRLYDIQPAEKSGKSRLFIEYIEGEKLSTKWRTITLGQKRTVMRKLADFALQMRRLRQSPTSGWIGSTYGNTTFDMLVRSEEGFGPFDDVKAYHDWRISIKFGHHHEETALKLQGIRRRLPDDHRICFTHGDISRRNILVKVYGDGDDDIEVTALLDWEQAGWRPEYWEAAKIVWGVKPEDDWYALALEMVTSGYEEYIKLEDELLLLCGTPW